MRIVSEPAAETIRITFEATPYEFRTMADGLSMAGKNAKAEGFLRRSDMMYSASNLIYDYLIAKNALDKS